MEPDSTGGGGVNETRNVERLIIHSGGHILNTVIRVLKFFGGIQIFNMGIHIAGVF